MPEARIVADLLLRQVTPDEWQKAIAKDNVLQKKSLNSATTYAGLARSRLQTMHAGLWEIVRDGNLREATDAVLAATVKFSPLFGDFLRLVVRDQFRRFSTELPPKAWEHYIDESERIDPDVARFTPGTRDKLRQNAMRMLQEAGFLVDTQGLKLRPHHIEPRVRRFLEDHQERYALECLLICP